MPNPLDTVIATLQNGVTAINNLIPIESGISTTLDNISTTLDTISTSINTFSTVNSPWTAYTPTISAGTGSFTTVSASGKFKQIGSVVFVSIQVVITTNNTAGTHVLASLPVAADASYIGIYYGRATVVSGKMLQGSQAGTGAIAIFNYDNSYPGSNGETLQVQGFYQPV